jgi:hypothetical protein
MLAELTRANLLAEPTPGRFAFHDLLHAYATAARGGTRRPRRQRARAGLVRHRTAGTARAVDQAVGSGFDTHGWQLAWTLADFLDRRGHWNHVVTIDQRRRRLGCVGPPDHRTVTGGRYQREAGNPWNRSHAFWAWYSASPGIRRMGTRLGAANPAVANHSCRCSAV